MHISSRSILVAVVLVAAGCSGPEDLGRVGDFSLTESSGRTVTQAHLSRKVSVFAFIFTRCAGPCSQVSYNLSQLRRQLGPQRDVVLVSVTVDPEYDTPEVLQQYAARYQADPQGWLFLTGERDVIYRLIRQDFYLGVDANEGPDRKPGYEVDHSSKLVLVDGRGHIRGYYSGTDPDDLPKLARQIQFLAWQNRLPAVNAVLNSTSALLLVLGYLAVRRKWIGLHKRCMLAALLVSALFLTSYLYYHFVVRGGEPTRFQGPDGVRGVYLTILLSHTLLAVVAAPLALVSAYLGLSNRLPRHVRLARWTLPIWLYVSVTGVVVYWMLYQAYPAP